MTLNITELQDLEAQFGVDFQEQVASNLGSEDLAGTDNDDTLIGSADSEAIVGLAGNDVLFGKSGHDTILGGQGDDFIESNGGSSVLIGNEGNDSLSAFSLIEAANGNSTLTGGQGEDILAGSTKEDLLYGGSEADTIDGSTGSDTLGGGSEADVLNGAKGNDVLFGDLGNDTVTGGDGDDLVTGGEGNDTLYDTRGHDRLTTGEGDDSLILFPDTGTDTVLDFQDGRDRFILVEDFPERGLTFEQLDISQSNGDTTIAIADTGEILTELTGVSAETVNAEDFETITTDEMLDRHGEAMAMEMTASSELGPVFDDLSTENTRLDSSADPSQHEASIEEPEPTSEIEIGAVTSQGVEAMNVDEARSNFGVDGEGITIGVISDSFDRALLTDISANDDVLSGDLPGENNPNGYTTPVNVLDDSRDNSTLGLLNERVVDEGRAMLQLIHDVAPGAELAFHTTGETPEDFAGAIDNLVDAGADIIVDDLSFYSEPFFQDGTAIQAVDAAAEAGVPYFTSAGNQGANSYEAEFRPIEAQDDLAIDDQLKERYVFHDFNPDEQEDLLQSIILQPGQSDVSLNFQWDEPFASAGGTGASNDLDLLVFDAENNLIDVSTESNLETDAYENVTLSNPSDRAVEYQLAVGYDITAGGSPPNVLKYVALGLNNEVLSAEYAAPSSTIAANNNSSDGVAVGAADYRLTPEFGTQPATLEESSSIGNTPILFDPQGNPLPEPEIREKPEIVAPDNTNTTFLFEGNDPDGDGFPNFPGTSAAAPHAAGVAALLLDANPEATPEQVYQALEQSALDMDNPYTQGADPGYDVATGNGFIQADRALEEILGTSDTELASLSADEAVI